MRHRHALDSLTTLRQDLAMFGRITSVVFLAIACLLVRPARSQEPKAAPPGDANAQGPTEASADAKAEARKLAQAALLALEEEDYAAALEAARGAEKLYHAPIHLRVVGQALEGLERRAEAALIYERLAAEPLPPSAHELFVEAQELAKERLKALSAELPSILVKVQGVAEDRARVTIDGEPFDATAETALRVDPGEHHVRVEAPGRLAFDETLKFEEGAGVVIVTARMRKPGEPESDEPIISSGGGATATSMPPLASWVLAGIGAAALIGGGVTGGLALAEAGDLEERCPDRRCPPSAESDHERAEIFGWTSTVALGVGAAAVVAAGIVWAVDGGEASDEMAFVFGPARLEVRGRF
jgi:hypothetical protein